MSNVFSTIFISVFTYLLECLLVLLRKITGWRELSAPPAAVLYNLLSPVEFSEKTWVKEILALGKSRTVRGDPPPWAAWTEALSYQHVRPGGNNHLLVLLIPQCMVSGNALILLPILWAVVAVGWAPMLLSTRLRDLCGRWPTERVALNYPLLITSVVGIHVVIFLAVGVQLPAGSPLLPAWAFGSTLLVVVVSWLVLAVILPATRDINLPANSRLPLAVGAIWYGVLVSIVFAVLALVLFAMFFPG